MTRTCYTKHICKSARLFGDVLYIVPFQKIALTFLLIGSLGSYN